MSRIMAQFDSFLPVPPENLIVSSSDGYSIYRRKISVNEIELVSQVVDDWDLLQDSNEEIPTRGLGFFELLRVLVLYCYAL